MGVNKSSRCSCGSNNKIFCVHCSRLKMVILLKNRNNHLKFVTQDGKLFNPVWYSILSKDKKPLESLINKMISRYHGSKYEGKANKLIFYDNITKQQIREIEL